MSDYLKEQLAGYYCSSYRLCRNLPENVRLGKRFAIGIYRYKHTDIKLSVDLSGPDPESAKYLYI